LATLRSWHAYIGMFIAPSVLFFALTGAVQLFNLHEAHGNYRPAPLVEKLSGVHKDQVFAAPHHDEPGPPGGKPKPGAGKSSDDDDAPRLSTVVLKWFYLVVALGLASSTVLGLSIGLTHSRRQRWSWMLLLAGTLIPIVLLLI
jgi:hypothetical protein